MNPKHLRIEWGTLPRRIQTRQFFAQSGFAATQTDQPSTKPMSAASTASNGATLPSSAVRQASNASIRRSVDSGVDFRASTAI